MPAAPQEHKGRSLIVAGHIGLDQIWQLDAPLRAGGRLALMSRRSRIGGAAANAGASLAVLGRRPILAAFVPADATGDLILGRLAAVGADVTAVARTPGTTRAGTILVGSDGERTLISSRPDRRPLPAVLLQGSFNTALVNLPHLADPWTMLGVMQLGQVVAQMPLDPDEPRPAHILLASRSDVCGSAAELWRRRFALDGPALRCIILTAGTNGAEVADADGVQWVAAASTVQGDSTGAGDFFAAGLVIYLQCGLPVLNAVVEAQTVAARLLASRPPPLNEWIE